MTRTQSYITAYRILRAAGLTHESALAMQGNWAKESLHDAFRKQGDLSAEAVPSHNYVAAVTSGAISRERFATDQIGFGLAQWTYYNFTSKRGRKLNLYDFWKKSGKALDDVTMQTEFAVWELENEYSSLYAELKKPNNLYYCTDIICKRYEQPEFNNVQDRYEAAREIGAVIAKSGEQEQVANEQKEERFWPPRMLCKNMNGPDVEALQGLLIAHGYTYGSTKGVFCDSTERAVRKYQDNNVDVDGNPLKVDGVAGNKTWGSLTKM